jgi:uncharacterized protein YuzE
MAKEFRFMYDDFSDRLMIASKKKDESIAGSIRILNLVLDITTSGRIANIELTNASKYLDSIGINPEILNNLTSAEIVIKQQRDGYLICFLLYSGTKLERIPYNIITEKPLLA